VKYVHKWNTEHID